MTTDEQIEREIRDKGLTAPRVTPASIEAKIKSEFYFTAEEGVIGRAAFQVESETLVSDLALPIAALASPSLERLTICVLILENGFTILGKSAPASAANFDAEMGRKIARADAINQIWPLEGYLLRQQLFTATKAEELDEYGAGVEQIAEACHEANRGYCAAMGDHSQPAWADAPQWQRDSAIAGVRFIQANPDATPEQSHESWLEQKRVDGWKYGPVKDPEKREHPCFVPYADLPVEQRAKDYIFGSIVRSLS